MALNIFKTHYSIGKSIMTFEEGDPKNVFEVAKQLGLEEVFVMDESMSGFMEALMASDKYKIPLRYGVILKHGEDNENISNFGMFALNTDGYKDLVRIYSTQEAGNGRLSTEQIRQMKTDNLWMVIPFYDSFLYRNLLDGKLCIFDLSFKPTLFIEDNNLPFDHLLKEDIVKVAKSHHCDTIDVQSVFYPNEDYFDAWQTLKIMNGRSYSGGDLGRPNLDHCSSTNFYAK